MRPVRRFVAHGDDAQNVDAARISGLGKRKEAGRHSNHHCWGVMGFLKC